MTDAPVIETERLILRPHGTADFEDMCAMWGDPEVTRFIGGKPSTREEAWIRLLRYAGTWALLGFGFWAMRERESGAFVGDVGFHDVKRALTPPFGDRPELGYVLAPWSHGRGFATEGAQAAVAWGERAWPGRETVCMIEAAHAASLRIAAKLGYAEMARTEYKGAPVVLLSRRNGGV
jgi:RimJ/RimL family protein N-acetyltransferase